MSAIVCGKRSFFEELPSPSTSKRIRRSSSSPVRTSPSRSAPGSIAAVPSASSSPMINHLISHFPDVDIKLLERALEECGNDVDLTIKRLNELRLCASNNVVDQSACSTEVTTQTEVVHDQDRASSEDLLSPKNLPKDGTEWVELFVREMASASNLDDARTRATRALESLEKSISTRVSSEVSQKSHQENTFLKEQIGVVSNENTILKRAVSIQHERQKEFDYKTQEIQHLKQLVSEYQEQLRTLEVNNYALSMHLKQSQQSNSIPGRFHPDIF